MTLVRAFLAPGEFPGTVKGTIDRPAGLKEGEYILVPVAVETVTISREKYEALERDSDFLAALEGAGVDNWDGYDFAVQAMNDNDDSSTEKGTS